MMNLSELKEALEGALFFVLRAGPAQLRALEELLNVPEPDPAALVAWGRAVGAEGGRRWGSASSQGETAPTQQKVRNDNPDTLAQQEALKARLEALREETAHALANA